MNPKWREDILQIDLPNGKIVDVGYYPPFKPGGEYVVLLVTEATPEAWDMPEIEYITPEYDEAIAWAESMARTMGGK